MHFQTDKLLLKCKISEKYIELQTSKYTWHLLEESHFSTVKYLKVMEV